MVISLSQFAETHLKDSRKSDYKALSGWFRFDAASGRHGERHHAAQCFRTFNWTDARSIINREMILLVACCNDGAPFFASMSQYNRNRRNGTKTVDVAELQHAVEYRAHRRRFYVRDHNIVPIRKRNPTCATALWPKSSAFDVALYGTTLGDASHNPPTVRLGFDTINADAPMLSNLKIQGHKELVI
jgi:hypothetical protein